MSSRLLPLVILFGCARPTEPLGSRESSLEAERAVEPEVGTFVEYDTPTTRAEGGPGNDRDADGVVGAEDPDDADPLFPAASAEIPCNAVDEDLDGVDLCPRDTDGDGVGTDLDCDDQNPGVGPLAGEIACDGRDQNCDGHDDCDADGDMVVDWDDQDPRDPSVPGWGSRADEGGARPGW